MQALSVLTSVFRAVTDNIYIVFILVGYTNCQGFLLLIKKIRAP
jgi:hypothetical protein